MANIVQTAVKAGSFQTLVKAVQTAGLADVLSGRGPYTVFAPNDVAFAKLPSGTVDNLLKDKSKLREVLTYHVVQGRHMAAEVAQKQSLKTVQGQNITVDSKGGVKVDGASVVQADIEADNGVIHVIDSVIMPK
ncbi:MAG: fasciclin domain-containing protein [Armatimonadetes bacterium]|nr:fasciclin domain-containing protein [Armatimonadota bacterium]